MTDEMERPIVLRVPRDASARRELLVVRPMAWEYLLFGSVLVGALSDVEPKWRDYHLGYSMSIGPQVPPTDLAIALQDHLSRAMAIVENLERIISTNAQKSAFGESGEPGDAALIEHMSERLILLYEQLLDWVNDLRSLRVPVQSQHAVELCVKFVEQPIEEVRAFVFRYVESLESGLAELAAGSTEQIQLEMTLTFALDPQLSKRFNKELRRAIQ